MAKQPSSFAEWLAQNQRATPARVAPTKALTGAPSLNAGQGDPPQSFLDWGIDILSRPLYAVTETADTAIEQGTEMLKRQKENTPYSFLDALGDAGELVSAPLRGLFSTNRDDKRTTSDLIEKATDELGTLDKNYVDEENNVNPWVKGIAGFVGDVGLDPLTYVPGAQIAKGLNVVGRAVKGATRAGTDIAKAVTDTKRAEKATESFTEALAKGVNDAEPDEAARLLQQAELMETVPPKAPKKVTYPGSTKPLDLADERLPFKPVGKPKEASVETAPAAKTEPWTEAGAQTALNAGIRAAQKVDGDAIRPESFGQYADAFKHGFDNASGQLGKGTSRTEQKRIWGDYMASRVAPAEPVALASEATKLIDEATPTPRVETPPTEALLQQFSEAKGGITTTKRGTPRVADVNAAMKALRADPEMRELLDTPVDVLEADGSISETLPMSSWLEDFFKGTDAEGEHLVGAIEDAMDTRRKAQAVEDTPQLVDNAESIVAESLQPKPKLTARQKQTRRAGEQLLDRLKNDPALDAIPAPRVEVPSFEAWARGMAAAPEAAGRAAVTIGGKALNYRDVPKFLAQGNKRSKAYREVYEELQQHYTAWSEKFVKHEQAGLPKGKKGTPLQRFSQLIDSEDGAELLEQMLGSRELANLRKTQSPAQLTNILAELSSVLQRQVDHNTIAAESVKLDTTKKFLQRAGLLEPERLPEPIQSTSNVGSGLTPVDAIARMASDTLSPEEEAVAKALKNVLGEDLFQYGNPLGGKRPFRSDSGAARTSKTPGEGYAVHERILNGPRMANFSEKSIKDISTKLTELNRRGKSGAAASGSGASRAAKVEAAYMAEAEIRDRLLQREGVMTYLGRNENDIPMLDTQWRSILHGASQEDLHDTYLFLYNVSTMVPPTNHLDVLAAAVRGAGRDELRELALRTQTSYAPKGGTPKQYKNALTSGGDFGHYMGSARTKQPPETQWFTQDARWRQNPNASGAGKKAPGFFLNYSGDALTERYLNWVERHRDELIGMRDENVKAAMSRIDAETGQLTEEGLARLDELVSNPTLMAQAIREVSRTDEMVSKMARAKGTTGDAEIVAQQNVRAATPVEDTIASKGSAQVADAQKRVNDTKAGKSSAQQKHNDLSDITDDATKVARDEALATPREERTPLQQALAAQSDEAFDSEQTAVRIDTSLDHVAAPTRISGVLGGLGERFVANYGMERIYRFMHGVETASATRRNATFKELQSLVARHGGRIKGGQSTIQSTNIDAAWRALQSGAKSFPSDPAVDAALKDLDVFMSKYFDTTAQESILGNRFFRTPASVDYMNRELASVGARLRNGEPVQFEIGKDSTMANVSEQWRLWDVEDPAELMLKLYAAAERVSTKAVIGQDLNRFAMQRGLRSSEAKAGYSRPVADGLLTSMLDADKFYDKELLSEVRRMEDFIEGSRSFKGEMGKFIHGFFDPIQQSWKYGMTVVRPGHHIRNLIGDASMTYLAEGMKHAVKANKDAIKVLATMHNKYDGIDFNRMLEGMQVRELPGGTDVIAKGRYGDLTIQQVYEAAFKRGLMNSYRHSEDVLDAGLAPGGFARFMDRASLRGGRIEQVAGGVSEGRDHYARLQHFMQYLHKAQDGSYPKFKSLDDLFDNAAHQVKKYHPDGSMLTPFEAKYMRRMIPFYSWLRGAIPALVESLAIHPARVSVFPKASYNLAVSMGINPDSLSNPFPTDQLFPSFLTDQVFGPQIETEEGGYLGINPGVASVDVANQFLAGNPVEGIGRGVLGAVTPLIRVPLELAAGGSWGTGAKINDTSDYIDASLPGVNYAANVTGQSVSGSLVSLLGGRGFDPQLQVERGNKDAEDQSLSVLNWLTGLGVQNMSRPNYINYAEIEKRDQAASDSDGSRSGF